MAAWRAGTKLIALGAAAPMADGGRRQVKQAQRTYLYSGRDTSGRPSSLASARLTGVAEGGRLRAEI